MISRVFKLSCYTRKQLSVCKYAFVDFDRNFFEAVVRISSYGSQNSFFFEYICQRDPAASFEPFGVGSVVGEDAGIGVAPFELHRIVELRIIRQPEISAVAPAVRVGILHKPGSVLFCLRLEILSREVIVISDDSDGVVRPVPVVIKSGVAVYLQVIGTYVFVTDRESAVFS